MGREGGRKRHKFLHRCCRREVYATIVAIVLWIFFFIAVVTPWYQMAATQLPPPWDSMTCVFYWTGMDSYYSPPLVNEQRHLHLAWTQMQTTRPKDVYMAALAMSILGLIATTVLIAGIFFGMICRKTTRVVSTTFCNYFKWPVVIACFIVLAFSIISWTCFFAFNDALYNAHLCPGTKYYGSPSIFPVGNVTFVEPLFCDSFADTRLKLGANWVWGPQAGWIFALLTTPLSCIVLWIMLTVPTGANWERIVREDNEI